MYIRRAGERVCLGVRWRRAQPDRPPALPVIAGAGCRPGPRREAVGKAGLLVGAPRSGGARACPRPRRFLGRGEGPKAPAPSITLGTSVSCVKHLLNPCKC